MGNFAEFPDEQKDLVKKNRAELKQLLPTVEEINKKIYTASFDEPYTPTGQEAQVLKRVNDLHGEFNNIMYKSRSIGGGKSRLGNQIHAPATPEMQTGDIQDEMPSGAHSVRR